LKNKNVKNVKYDQNKKVKTFFYIYGENRESRMIENSDFINVKTLKFTSFNDFKNAH